MPSLISKFSFFVYIFYSATRKNPRKLFLFHGRIFISSRPPHQYSRTFTEEFLFPHGHLTDAHGLSRTIFDFPTDTSRTLTDFHGQFLTFPRTPHGSSWVFTDKFSFTYGQLTDAHGLSRTILDFPTDASRTLTDEFLFPHGHLTEAHGISRTILDFPTDTSRTFMDFYGRIWIFPRTPHGRARAPYRIRHL